MLLGPPVVLDAGGGVPGVVPGEAAEDGVVVGVPRGEGGPERVGLEVGQVDR